VEVGRGSSGRRCHDGGEGQHEVSPCLVLIKSFVSISKYINLGETYAYCRRHVVSSGFILNYLFAEKSAGDWRHPTWLRCDDDFVLGNVG
jgi:hypothetical protein